MNHNKPAAALIAAAIAAAPTAALAEDEQISVYVDGVQIEFDVDPVTEDDRTLVPMRAIFEALGAEVAWDDDVQTATATRGDDTVSITIDSNILYKNGETTELDVPVRMIDDRTLVPVRAISESFGAEVEWDEETQTVIITSGGMLTVGTLNDEDMQKLQERMGDIRYNFEQDYLAGAVYSEAEAGTLYELLDEDTLADYVSNVWYNCVLSEIVDIQAESESEYYLPEGMSEEEMIDAYYDLIIESGIEMPISGVAVTDVAVSETDEAGLRVGVVVFNEADTDYECKFIGIVADTDGGASYFTAENDPYDSLNWYICEQYETGHFIVAAMTAKSGSEETDLNTFGQLIVETYLSETSGGE